MMWYIVDQSAKIFIEEVSKRIPWWTGQARGTFVPATRLLQYAKVNLFLDIRHATMPSKGKSFNTGYKYGKASREKNGNSYVIHVGSTLGYMVENEFVNQPKTLGQQRERAWNILLEVKPIVQEEINKLVKYELRNFISKIIIR